MRQTIIKRKKKKKKMIHIKTQDLSKTLKDYSNIWLALDPDSMKVIATGKEPKIAISKARKNGIKNPVITRAPKNYGAYIL